MSAIQGMSQGHEEGKFPLGIRCKPGTERRLQDLEASKEKPKVDFSLFVQEPRILNTWPTYWLQFLQRSRNLPLRFRSTAGGKANRNLHEYTPEETKRLLAKHQEKCKRVSVAMAKMIREMKRVA